jgi:uncharacterized protein YndB with AHSA1/START domain
MRRDRGTAVGDGAHATLRFERFYRHTPAHVWEAIATPEGLAGWLICSHALIEGRAGGRVELVSGPSAFRSTGKVLAWEPERLFEYEWNVQPTPEMPRGENAIFRYELFPEQGGTRLLVVYRRITAQTARGFLPGLHAFLDRLEAQLDGAPLPGWVERFAAIREEYPEWTGHADS